MLPVRPLLLALLATALLAAPPQIYRWRDRSGKEHITNTPPPPGATRLDVPPAQGSPNPQTADAQAQDPALKGARAQAAGLEAGQAEWWSALDQRLEEARAKQDTAAIEAIVEGIFREALWGRGAWAIPVLPIATLALVVLLGWWIARGRGQPLASGLVALSVVAGLVLGQLTLSRFLYRLQLVRLQSHLALLEGHLGGKLPRGSNRAALAQHLAALEAATRPSALPWAFPLECRNAEDTMVKVALDP